MKVQFWTQKLQSRMGSSYRQPAEVILCSLILICVLSLGSLGGLKPVNALEDVKCGYESCPSVKPGMINVHLIPHTHDDVGWLITVDQYFYKEVQWILDGVVRELAADPSKRFIYVEIAFFERWFEQQNNATRQLVKQLVNEGRLEFILGGWCMNDEAAPHYTAMIDQHKLGFEYLRNKFGKCGRTKIGWQIDPFGHSREQASLFAQFGFDGLFFGRLDYQDKDQREKSKTMEMVWQGSPKNLGSKADLFTGVLPNGYNPPSGFCFDITCSDFNTVIQDDPKLHDYNVPNMVDKFLFWALEWNSWYATDHLIMPMGSDFNYVQADMWFKEMDKLIKYVNARQAVGSNINVLYSTPSCYLKAVHDSNRTWTTKEDDFFPYADRPHTFWTGYFTSRPAFKYYARVVNSFFQGIKQLAALTKLNNKDGSGEQLKRIAETLGVAQHHDAISGTAKQAVDYDYSERLSDGVHAAQPVVADVYNMLLPKHGGAAPTQEFCLLLNESLCTVSEHHSKFQMTMYNPLARPVEFYAQLPVGGVLYNVTADDGKTNVPCDVLALSPDTDRIPSTRDRTARNDLFFKASLPALGFKTYFVEKTFPLKFASEKKQDKSSSGLVIKGKYVSVKFDSQGYVRSLTNLQSQLTVPLSQSLLYYEAFPGNNSKASQQASGAYIFRPVHTTPVNISLSVWAGSAKGGLVQEVYQEFTPWASQVWRVYMDKPYVEVQWTVGPIPVNDSIGKEVVTRYNIPGWKTKKTFYTDANGREVLQRVYDYRPTWKLNQTEPVAGNYYPVNAFTYIKDVASETQLTVLVDRTQGGASLNDGDLELMLHRRLLHDDAKGVGEALNERGIDGKGLVVRGCHYLFVEKASSSARMYRPLAQEVFLRPQVSFSTVGDTPQQYVDKYHTAWSGLTTTGLPSNVHLLTMEQFYTTGPLPSPSGTVPYLVRFEHFYENDEDQELSKPVTFDIKGMFVGFSIVSIHELSLGGNIPIEEVHRLQWKTGGHSYQTDSRFSSPKGHVTNTTLTLNPMEIITLQVDLAM